MAVWLLKCLKPQISRWKLCLKKLFTGCTKLWGQEKSHYCESPVNEKSITDPSKGVSKSLKGAGVYSCKSAQ